MRRWSLFVVAFSLLAMASVGCWEHTAGVCDCDPWHDHHALLEGHGMAHSYADVPHAGSVPAVAMPQAAQ